MDRVVKESQWVGDLGNLSALVKYRVIESDLNHLFYVEKARKKDPTYFRRITNGFITKQPAIKEFDNIIKGEMVVESINRKANIYVPKSKRQKLYRCKK
jgi:hypothetical protein